MVQNSDSVKPKEKCGFGQGDLDVDVLPQSCAEPTYLYICISQHRQLSLMASNYLEVTFIIDVSIL